MDPNGVRLRVRLGLGGAGDPRLLIAQIAHMEVAGRPVVESVGGQRSSRRRSRPIGVEVVGVVRPEVDDADEEHEEQWEDDCELGKGGWSRAASSGPARPVERAGRGGGDGGHAVTVP